MIKIGEHIHWLVRVVLAITFVLHGYPKLGYDLGMDYLGYLVGPFELFGGIFLLIGPFVKNNITRIGGLMIAIIMLGAIFKFHLYQGWKMHATVESIPYTRGFEWQVLILVVSLLFVFKGDEV